MIIHSLLDTDLYKFTMMQVVLHHFPGARVEYRFKCRNPGVNLAQFAGQIRDEIRSLCSLQFRDAELAYLRSMRFIKSDFVDFLGLFRLNEKYINIIPQPSGEVKEQWGKLTDDDFDVIAGKRDQLLGRIQERHGISRDEAEKQVKDWESRDGRSPDALWFERY